MESSRVFHVTFSSSGGAGLAAARLAGAQKQLGLDSTLVSQTSMSLWENPLALPIVTAASAFDHFIARKADFDNQVSLLRQGTGNSTKRIDFSDSFVHLHWLPGIAAVRQLTNLSSAKKVFVHLHDELAYTGVCHFAGGCEGFRSGCSNCPAVHSIFHQQVTQLLENKAKAYSDLDVIFIAPSDALVSRLKSSTAYRGQRVEVISNLVPDVFWSASKWATISPIENKYLVAVASDLSDPRKRISELVRLHARWQEEGNIPELYLVGSKGERFQSSSVRALGPLNQQDLASVLSRSFALVTLADEESAPLSIMEAAATGTPTLTFRGSRLESWIVGEGIGHTFESDHSWTDVEKNIVRYRLSNGTVNFGTKHKTSAILEQFNQLYLDVRAEGR